MTGDGGDGWHGKREKFRDDKAEAIVDHARVVVLCLVDAVAIGEEFAVCAAVMRVEEVVEMKKRIETVLLRAEEIKRGEVRMREKEQLIEKKNSFVL